VDVRECQRIHRVKSNFKRRPSTAANQHNAGPPPPQKQTAGPKHVQRLARRRDSKRVVVGVAGGYLKIFEFARSMAWAVGLLARYPRGETVT
jgi:hypothetical protein